MRGHTKEQLEGRGAHLENYNYCKKCELYWARHVYKKHLEIAPVTEIAIIPPAMESFLNFLADSAVRTFVEEHTVTLPDGTKIPPRFTLSPEWEAIAKEEESVFTVDEAVERFGVSREAIMANIEESAEVFSVEIPGTRRAGQKKRRRAPDQDVRALAPGSARPSTP